MKVTLQDGRVCQIGVCYGDEQPILERPPQAKGRHRSVRIDLTVFGEDGQILGKRTGVSYCSPADPFSRFEGRKRAMKRLFISDNIRVGFVDQTYSLLSKQDKQQLVPILLARKVQVKVNKPKKLQTQTDGEIGSQMGQLARAIGLIE
jgi:hypothetical protein